MVSVMVRSMVTVVTVRAVGVVRTRVSTRAVGVGTIRTSLEVGVHIEVRLDVAWQSMRVLAATTATKCIRHAGLEVGDLVFNGRLPLAERSRKHTALLGQTSERSAIGTVL